MTPAAAMTRTAAIERGCALFAALGRADRLAREATVPFCPPRENLRRYLLLYAWSTRCRKDLAPEFRERARSAVRAYRALRMQGRVT